MAPHKLNLEVPELFFRDNKRKLQLSFATTVSLELPSKKFFTSDELWKQLDVQMHQGFQLSIQLLWNHRPLPDHLLNISETLGRQLANADFWEQQLSLKTNLSIPSADKIVITPKPTIPFAHPPATTPICRLLSVQNVCSFEARDGGDADGGICVEDILPLTNVALKALFKGVLGKDGVTGGVFLGGYSAELSGRQKHWDGIASSVLSVAGRAGVDNGDALRTQLNDLRAKILHPDVPTCLKANLYTMVSRFLLAKSRKVIKPSIVSDSQDSSTKDDKFCDLSAEKVMEENTQDLLEDDEWLLDDLGESQILFDGEILSDDEEGVNMFGEESIGGSYDDMVDDVERRVIHDKDMLEERAHESVQLYQSSSATSEVALDFHDSDDMLDNDELENQHPHLLTGYAADTPDLHHDMLDNSECQSVCSMLDDDHSSNTQSTMSNAPSPASLEFLDEVLMIQDQHIHFEYTQKRPDDMIFDDDESAMQMLEDFMDI